MNYFEKVQEIAEQVVAGTFEHPYVNIRPHHNDPYVTLKYSKTAQFANEWSETEQACRGLIINYQTGEVVALPFPKFFNWGQLGKTTQAGVERVYEKMDGSLGILYRDTEERFKVATAGSAISEQALWATQRLEDYNLEWLKAMPEMTLLFEIIYSNNRIVVEYEYEGLVLLGAYNRFTGEEYTWDVVEQCASMAGFRLPKVYEVGLEVLLKMKEESHAKVEEGWVVLFKDGSRFKIKRDDYVLLHKQLSNFSTKFVAESIVMRELDNLYATMPDEIHAEIDQIVEETIQYVGRRSKQFEMLWEAAPKDTAKALALHAKGWEDRTLFALAMSTFNGREIDLLATFTNELWETRFKRRV